MKDNILNGAITGFMASLLFWLLELLREKTIECRETRRILNWLRENTPDSNGNYFRSTRTIASYNDLTEDRVRYLCSKDSRIYLSTGTQEDIWALYEKRPRDSL